MSYDGFQGSQAAQAANIAAQGYANHVAAAAQGLGIPTKPAVPELPRLHDDLSQMIAHVEQMSAMTGKLANELFGPPPPQVMPTNDAPRGNGMVGELRVSADVLRQRLADLYGIMQRFQALA